MKYLFSALLLVAALHTQAQEEDEFRPARFYFGFSAVGAFPTEDFKDKAQAGDGYGFEIDALYDVSKSGFFQVGVGFSYLLQATERFDQTVQVENQPLDVETTVNYQILAPYIKARVMARPRNRFSPFASVALAARAFQTSSSYSYYAEPTFLETLFGVEDEEHTVSNREHEDWSAAVELAGGITYNVHRNFDIQLQAFRIFGGETAYVNRGSLWQDGPDSFQFETTTSKTNMWGIKLGLTLLLY